MNIAVFAPEKRVIDRFRFPKFKSFGKLTNFAADGITPDLAFDRLDIRSIANGNALCPGFIPSNLISG